MSRRAIIVSAVGGAVLLIGGSAAAMGLSGGIAFNNASATTTTVAPASSTSTTATSTTTTTTAKPQNPLKVALVDAVQKTSAANTCDMTMTISSTGSDGISATGSGAFDFAHSRGTETISLGSGPGMPSWNFTVVIDGTTIYEKMPADLLSDPSKPWIKTDSSTLAASEDASSLATDQSSDPSKGLAMLLATGDQVTTVGTEKLRGVSTTHYKVQLDFKTAAANASDSTQKAELSQLAQLYTKPLPVDVWIDSSNRVRKLVYAVDSSQLPGADSSAGTMSFTLEFYNFGASVNVTIPPASQVTDLNTLNGNGTDGSTTTTTMGSKGGTTA